VGNEEQSLWWNCPASFHYRKTKNGFPAWVYQEIKEAAQSGIANRKAASYPVEERMEVMNSNNPHIGSSLEDWLEEEGLLEDATNFAIKSVIAWQVGQYMQNNQMTKTAMAKRMSTSRAALDRLLDPGNDSITLKTLQNAARAVGARVELNLVFKEKAA